MIEILKGREQQVYEGGKAGAFEIACDKESLAGSVSQRACVFCGSRVVLYPIADALHVVHGPVGCAAYTWDIRGALSSGPELHRMSFTTDLKERDVIFGGEKKLHKVLTELIDTYHPKAAFVYGTCIVGVIGDDMDAVCRTVSREKNLDVIPVHAEGFKGTKKNGYQAACRALSTIIGTGDTSDIPAASLNILGDFNIAGETWQIKKYYERMVIHVVSTITGDGRVDEIRRAHGARLNVVQCSGSMMTLAQLMQERWGIPFIQVSYFGIEDMTKALYDVAERLGDRVMMERTQSIVQEEIGAIMPEIHSYREKLEGAKALIYTGGAFKVFSLVRSLRTLGMKTVVAGSQTGDKDDYEQLRELCEEGTVLLDDTNPMELAKYIQEKDIDLVIGGVKERPIAYKLGVGFCDHNHERKIGLAGYSGMLNFAREVYASVCSPVWSLMPRRREFKGGLR